MKKFFFLLLLTIGTISLANAATTVNVVINGQSYTHQYNENLDDLPGNGEVIPLSGYNPSNITGPYTIRVTWFSDNGTGSFSMSGVSDGTGSDLQILWDWFWQYG